MKLFTRQETIDMWSKQPAEILNSFCCIHCRSILTRHKSNNNIFLCSFCGNVYEKDLNSDDNEFFLI